MCVPDKQQGETSETICAWRAHGAPLDCYTGQKLGKFLAQGTTQGAKTRDVHHSRGEGSSQAPSCLTVPLTNNICPKTI